MYSLNKKRSKIYSKISPYFLKKILKKIFIVSGFIENYYHYKGNSGPITDLTSVANYPTITDTVKNIINTSNKANRINIPEYLKL